MYRYKATPSDDSNIKKRLQLVRGLIDELGLFTQIAGIDNDIRLVIPDLSSRWLLRLPARGNVIAYVPRADVPLRDAVFIVPVFRADTWLVDPASRQYHNFAKPHRFAPWYGAYYRSSRSIFLPAEWGLARRMLALSLFHEGIHSFQHRRYGASCLTGAGSEREARRLEQRLLSKLYGTAWDDLIDQVSFGTSSEIETENRAEVCAPSADRLPDSALQSLTHGTLSSNDCQMLRTLVGRGVENRYRQEA